MSVVSAQESCNCQSELDFVIDYYEKNLPGFSDNVNSKNQKQYLEFKADLLEASKKVSNEVECFKIITFFVEFFKDNHSKISMSMPSIDDNNKEEITAFLNSDLFKSRETYNLTKPDLKQYPESDIRGLYTTANHAYTIAVIPNKGLMHDYIGVIVDSKTKLWKKGQVKLEIKLTDDGNNVAFVYMKNHSLRYYNRFPLYNGILGDGWYKTSKTELVNPAINSKEEFDVRKINDSTVYLKIQTFSGSQTSKINALYEKAKPLITSAPYLLIDVRNNGGGSDKNAIPLLDYMYTNPIKGDQVDLYVTKDNIKMWEHWYSSISKDTLNYGEDVRTWFKELINTMKASELNSFVLRDKAGTLEMENILKTPKKILIIQNRYCASSCETLLFWAKQSDKTILVGENSGGYVGYGEVGSIKTPCYNFDLFCTMTRYNNQRKYEVIGVTPDYRLNYQDDWIKQSLNILYKKD